MPQLPPAPSGWDDILAPGERILWQGRAEPRLDWPLLLHKRSLSAGILVVFALSWLGMTLPQLGLGPDGIPFIFPLAGLLFLGIGLSTFFSPVLRSYRRLRATSYTLTSQNAVIATQVMGKRQLESHPLGTAIRPALEEGSPGSVWFAAAPAARGNWRGSGASGSYGGSGARIGFEAISEARHVYRLMLDQLSQMAAEAQQERQASAARNAPPPAPPPPAPPLASATPPPVVPPPGGKAS